ncbi:KH domain-containing protein [Limnofasciculus baicalensis]|uniref:KH domain-containing protein n=1 Tax=Limnofasciculus baicalensis BBK-W-15 TaxID=2699891 RepID=A0AAE3GV89_9CYAN|nr:KH domain-containing protein [Limnofasciculus baicalensis]MCP2730508.1 KH domain-containing protein [Limnofasciculus baicalensis BBK-W-15]
MLQRADDTSPNYVDLVRFLIEPFLESPNSLSLDCEKLNANERIWIRLAFGGEEKGRVFGRGGRNIQAIRTVIQAAAQAAGQSVHLDIYDESAEGKSRSEPSNGGRFVARRSPPRPPSRPSKPEPRPRF